MFKCSINGSTEWTSLRSECLILRNCGNHKMGKRKKIDDFFRKLRDDYGVTGILMILD